VILAQANEGGGNLDAKEAIRRALYEVAAVYADEHISDLGLEEVEYEDATGEWAITVGFSRPWDYPPRSPLDAAAQAGLKPKPRPLSRTYKVVRIDDTGAFKSLKNRDV
jgi:hypothetical protein